MIKIKSGVYGYKNKKGSVQPKTSKDAPFSLSPEAEARLVKRGVAVYVTADSGAEPKPEYDADTKVNDLRDLMTAVGLTFNVGMTKADMIAALDEYYGVDDDGEGNDGDDEDSDGGIEPLPALDAEQPVS